MIKVMKVGQGILIDCYGNGIYCQSSWEPNIGKVRSEKLHPIFQSERFDLNINTRFHETTRRITRVHTPQQVQNSMTFP